MSWSLVNLNCGLNIQTEFHINICTGVKQLLFLCSRKGSMCYIDSIHSLQNSTKTDTDNRQYNHNDKNQRLLVRLLKASFVLKCISLRHIVWSYLFLWFCVACLEEGDYFWPDPDFTCFKDSYRSEKKVKLMKRYYWQYEQTVRSVLNNLSRRQISHL